MVQTLLPQPAASTGLHQRPADSSAPCGCTVLSASPGGFGEMSTQEGKLQPTSAQLQLSKSWLQPHDCQGLRCFPWAAGKPHPGRQTERSGHSPPEGTPCFVETSSTILNTQNKQWEVHQPLYKLLSTLGAAPWLCHPACLLSPKKAQTGKWGLSARGTDNFQSSGGAWLPPRKPKGNNFPPLCCSLLPQPILWQWSQEQCMICRSGLFCWHNAFCLQLLKYKNRSLRAFSRL